MKNSKKTKEESKPAVQETAPMQTVQETQSKLNFKLWLEVLIKPVETIVQEKQNQNWRNALLNYAISGLIAGLIIGIALLVIIFLYPSSLGTEAALLPSSQLTIILSCVILLPILWAAMLLISSFINTIIFWVFSKIFNGKGSYLTQYYLTSIYSAPLNIIVVFLMLIPIAALSLILLLILLLCSIFYLFIALKTTHEYSTQDAVLSIATPVIILLVIVFLASNLP